MKLVKMLIVSVCLIMISVPSDAMVSKVGTAGALFLKIGMDARSVAMGEACAALEGSAASAFSNPAGLAGLQAQQIYVTDTEWIADIRLIGGVYALPYGRNGVAALSAVCIDYGEMPMVEETEADVVVGTFSPKDIALGLSYARRWTDRLFVGGSLKYIDQSIADYHSRGFAFDFGTVYYTGFRSLKLAMATSNFGPDMSFDGGYVDKYYIGTSYVETDKTFGQYDLPLNFRVGLAYDFDLSPTSRLTAAIDATHPNDYSERVHFGAEYSWCKALFLRAGYATNSEEAGLSAGCGLRLSTSSGSGSVDYAYTSFGVFKSVHRFAIGISF
jgi:long-subunit fatty acid transport protein